MNRRGSSPGSDLDLSFTESALQTLNRNGTAKEVRESWGCRAEQTKMKSGFCMEQHTGTQLQENRTEGREQELSPVPSAWTALSAPLFCNWQSDLLKKGEMICKKNRFEFSLGSQSVSEVCSEMPRLPPVELEESKAAAGSDEIRMQNQPCSA